ncbi:MAG: iron-containing alcohol dehydrogenase [Candidatus Obscuribacterales bacterium]|nr:iron-containing alcohol dehydrogenase [Candidatus Obscuribacterales bacterium]
MNLFSYLCPTRITFGDGTASGIGDILSEMAVSNPLIVTDKVLVEKGVLDPVLKSLADSGLKEVPIFQDVPSDSDVDCVRRAVELGKSKNCDSLIAVGGGSVIDTAKVVNIGLSMGGDLLDFEGINNLYSPLMPMVAVPTTAGTGSEVSAVAMIKDYESGKKLLFGSRFLYVNAAVLDPTMLVTLPPRLTAATGLDAVTHAIEAYVAMGANPITDSLALQSLQLLFQYLPIATASGDNLEARAQTLLASTMAGMSFTNSGVGIVHALAHTVGAKYSVHHGIANAIFLPHGMEFNIEASAARYAQVWTYLCTAFSGCSSANKALGDKFVSVADPVQAAYQLVNAVRELLKDCSLPDKLRDVKVPEFSESSLQELAETAMTDPAIMFNPREASPDDLISILKEAY